MARAKGMPNVGTVFAADFETCDSDVLYKTIEHKIDSNTVVKKDIYDQRVWFSGFMDIITKEKQTFNNLDDFMKKILFMNKDKTTRIYFHNLKFDGSFIVPWLEANGYMFDPLMKEKKTYNVLVDKMNNWFNIEIRRSKKAKIEIWDTVKIFPMPLRELPDVYGTPTQKIKEDTNFYDKKRPIGHQPDEKENDYFHNDLQVLAETMEAHFNFFDGVIKTTQAAQSWHSFTNHYKFHYLEFPSLSNEEDKLIRKAYAGGISYVPPHYAGLEFEEVSVLDVNSMFPHKAGYEKLPFGNGTLVEGDTHPPMARFWVAEALVYLKLKPNHLPCISWKMVSTSSQQVNSTKDKWVHESGEGGIIVTFSSIDYTNLHKSYDYEIIEWNWHMKYSHKVNQKVQEFVEMNNTVKVTERANGRKARSEGRINQAVVHEAKAQRAKIDNNSFYGKFGEDIERINKIPTLGEDDKIKWEIGASSLVGDRSRKYLPVAIAITAHARTQLIIMANILGEHFLYCDTDSVHYLKTGQWKIDKALKEGLIEMDSLKLGSWAHEGDYSKAKYLRPKAYMEFNSEEEKWETTLAGLPADSGESSGSKKRSAITFENFKFGYEISAELSNKLRTINTRTGTKLLSVPFKISENTLSDDLSQLTNDLDSDKEGFEWKTAEME